MLITYTTLLGWFFASGFWMLKYPVENIAKAWKNRTTPYMEFLNPEDKRNRTIRLFIGYALIAVMIALASAILVYLAQGYGYDPNKGLSQQGLVFIDSKPAATEILVDGQKSNDRVTLGEGSHEVTLKKAKYRDWSKSFNLEGGTVMYFVYPRLFPVDIPIGVTKVFPTPPAWVSQSPDRHWLLMQQTAESPVLTVFDLLNPHDDPKLLTIPADQLAVIKGQYGKIAPVEWSDDNQHVLMIQTSADGKKNYLVLDKDNTDKTVNITSKLNLIDGSVVTLRDKKYDKYFVHDVTTGELRTADLKNGLVASPILAGVVSFKSYADNLLLYTTYTGAKANEAKVYALSNQTDKYLLQSLPRDPNSQYLLDMAQFDNNWYYVTASVSGNQVYVFRNPLKRTKPSNKEAVVPQMSLALQNPQYVSFSENTRFIGMQSGKKFVVYDGEQNKVFKYSSPLNIAPTQQAKWMDGHRYKVVTDNKVQVFEFDGTNQQTLIASSPDFMAYFDRDYTYVYTLINQADGKIGFENGKLIIN